MFNVGGVGNSTATLAASKKENDCKASIRESTPPKRSSMKNRMVRKVKTKTIEYAMANPEEVIKCYAQCDNPKRRLALQAMGVRGKMKTGNTIKGTTITDEIKGSLDEIQAIGTKIKIQTSKKSKKSRFHAFDSFLENNLCLCGG